MKSIDIELKQAIKEAVKKAFDIELEENNIVIETPKVKDHGDFSTNVAMQLTRQLRQNPRMIAEKIVANIESENVEKWILPDQDLSTLFFQKDVLQK